MKINRDNYEGFFLDLIEGRLAQEMREEVELFLLQNPDLAAELHEVSGFTLSAPSSDHVEKLDLYRSAAPGEAPVYPPVAKKEPAGQMRPVLLPKLKAPAIAFAGKHALYHQLNSSSWNLLPGWGARMYTRLHVSDLKGLKANGILPKLVAPAIVFEHKASLKRNEAVVIPMAPVVAQTGRVISMRRSFYYGAAAAAIAALLWIGTTDHGDPGLAVSPAPSPTRTEKNDGNNQNAAKELAAPQDSIENQENTVQSPENKEAPVIAPQWASPNEATPSDFAHEKVPSYVPNKPIVPEQQKEKEQQNDREQPERIIPLEVSPKELYSTEDVALSPVHPADSAKENETAPVVTNINEDPEGWRLTAAASGNSSTFSNLWDYAKDRAKSRMWGDNNYPKNDFTFSLLKKELGKSETISENFDLETPAETKSGKFHLRLGRYSFTRD